MDKEIKNLSMPISKMEFSDTINPSLSKCSIYVMHTGENLNGSSFSDDSVLNAKDTLKNIPILASIKRDEDYNPIDFEGHEMETRVIEKTNGDLDWKIVYIEKPIGVIPESNNYRVETLENGEKWVVVDGYIWKEYGNGAYDLLKNDDKKVSMEISVVDGYFDDNFMYHINKFNYLGVTVLGDNCPPAMGSNAVISLFKQDENAKEEYNKLLSEVNNLEGGSDLQEYNNEIIIETEQEEIKENETEFNQDENIEIERIVENEETIEAKEDFEGRYNEVLTELNELKATYTDLNSNYLALQEENKTLAEFKLNIEKQQKDFELNDIFKEYSALSKVDGYNELFEKRYELDKEELVKSLKVLAFDNNIQINNKNKKDFSKNTIKVPVFSSHSESDTNSAWGILDKHIKTIN